MNAVDMLSAARAEALFVSDASVTDHLTRQEVAALIRKAVLSHHGVRGCAAEVAAAYGNYPELAPLRMRWARAVVEPLYPVRRVRARSASAQASHDLAA